jgi:hypothetical protein
MGHAASPSLYDFCNGDPVNFFDPTGRCKNGQNGQDNGDGTFMWNGQKVKYDQGDGLRITPADMANAVNALNSGQNDPITAQAILDRIEKLSALADAYDANRGFLDRLFNGNPYNEQAIQLIRTMDQIGLGIAVYNATASADQQIDPKTFDFRGADAASLQKIGLTTQQIALVLATFGATKVSSALETETTTVIGRVKDLKNLGPDEQSLLDRLPDQGDPQANWQQNSGALRQEMNRGLPIRDASPGDTGGPFLNAERNLLRDRGWNYDPKTSLWTPPTKG